MDTIEDTLEDEYTIASFLTLSGQHHVSGQYEKLTAEYGEDLASTLDIRIEDETAWYELTVDQEQDNIMPTIDEDPLNLSGLLGRRDDFPQTFEGEIDPEQAANAYESVTEEV